MADPTPPIYLDHHATTPVDARVLEAMLPYETEHFGNASSASHAYGWRAEAAVDDARQRLAGAIGADPSEIVFTSGTTESDNLALKGVARAGRRRGDHLVTVATEHPAVLEAMAEVVKVCKEHDVPVGHPHVNASNAERIIGEGYRFLMSAPVRTTPGLDKALELSGRA